LIYIRPVKVQDSRDFQSAAAPSHSLLTGRLSNRFIKGETHIMAKQICKLLGIVLLIVGLLGFTHLLDPLGAHVGPAHATHNLVHIVSGILALYFGFAGSPSSARAFCLLFGAVYLLLGVVGLAKGTIDIPAIKLVLGQVDHLIHIVLGIGFLAGGLLSRK
jgi:Domain of unknown function (DUF4383)